MKKSIGVLCFVFLLVFSLGIVIAEEESNATIESVKIIECSEADYDGDGDVGFEDLFKFRECYNINYTENCSFWDFNNDGYVGAADLSSFRTWYEKTCPVEIECSEADYDGDGDVDATDILKYNQCNPDSESYDPNATID
ncbi:hypothetical protein HOA55_00060 [archaeon]|jgi:hypothetical protein|nr:hypothetical protein [archaeon]MBT3577903.1 hypothetical protein [archaeon]MBT6819733.1 hypothetical protein [archaeon]MBT6956017.1 hypothetical protein [archaeon]MBT7025516.1 hypothetical protein [archaeon]